MTHLEDHFQNPRNAGRLADPDLRVSARDETCGDELRLDVALDPARERVRDARFQVYGCPATVSAGSVLAEGVIGRRPSELSDWVERSFDGVFDAFSDAEAHAAALAARAIAALLDQWNDGRSREG